MPRTFTRANGHRALSSAIAVTGVPFTATAWIKPASAVTATAISLDTAAGSGYLIGGMLASGAAFAEAGTTDRASSNTGDFPVGEWHHLAVTVDESSICTVYRDGVARDTGSIPALGTLTHIGVGALDLGSGGGGVVSFFDGDIGQVGLWDDDLTATEVLALVTDTPDNVRNTDLVGYWPLTGTSTTTEPDAVGSADLTLSGTTGVPAHSTGSTPVDPTGGGGVGPANTVAPHITSDGTPQTGETVSCSQGTWTGDATITYAYQWKRNGTNISGATSSTYTLQVADEGQTVSCTVTATNSTSSASQAANNTLTPSAASTGGGGGGGGSASTALSGQLRVLIDSAWVDVNLGGASVLSEPAPVFRPDKYDGWFGDGVTSDLAAWRACLADLFQTGMDDGTYYGRLQMPVGVSYVGGAPIKVNTGGLVLHTKLPLLPLVSGSYQPLAMTGKKFLPEFVGTLDQNVFQHWKQTVVQDAGCIVRDDYSTTSGDRTTYGRPSVFGCPTTDSDLWGSESGGGSGAMESKWNNVKPYWRGIGILLPVDPHTCGLDFRSAANVNVDNWAVIAGLTGAGGLTAGDNSATQDWQFGVATPENNNNAKSRLGDGSAIGMNYGAMVNEHTVFNEIAALFCAAAVEFGAQTGTGHTITGKRILAENCQVIIGAAEAGWPTKIEIDEISCESISAFAVNDSSNRLSGTVRSITGIGVSNPLIDPSSGASKVNGAENLRIFDGSWQPGVYDDTGARQVANSAAEKRNPFFRDVHVRFTANPPTDLAVRTAGAGAATSIGAPSTGQWIPVPTGAFLKPTWTGTRPSAQWMVS